MQTGSRLGPYEILAPLGAGGMGEVWRARDHRLQREVAIKVMLGTMARSDDGLARFEREARAVAALSHPNILSIHDFGTEGETLFAVMELLEGATLRERLTESELGIPRALDWGHQIAQGLAAAHERGITHRDLKPENIFVTRDGVVKILDFGLARLDDDAAAMLADQDKTLARTVPGTIIGTFAYLSPEQARGGAADPRSDIFAFGAVFFEMLMGRPAFLRSTSADTLVAVLREGPRQPADTGKILPADVEEILHHCLEKHPDERFRTARDLAFALKLAGRTPATPTPELQRHTPRPTESGASPSELSIAVLPFRNMSPNADAEYFSDGMTEEIINSLAAVPALRVAARTTSFSLKGRSDDVRRIGNELGVAMVLEGSVRQSGARLRVTAQLISVGDGYQLWSNRWDRDLADVFAVQDEIAQAIASTLKVRFEEEALAAGKGTRNVDAYDRYLKANYLWRQRRAVDAIAEFDAAIEIDPNFAEARTGLADAWAVRGFYGGVPTWEAWGRARAAVDEAERIAPDSASVSLSRGIQEHYYGWNTVRCQDYCRAAIERNPKSADGFNWLAINLAGSGRRNEAVEAANRGIEVEPHDGNVRTSKAWAYLLSGDYEEGLRLTQEAVDVDATGYALWSHGSALRYVGQFQESLQILTGLVDASGGRSSFYLSVLGGSLAASGQTGRAEEILRTLRERKEKGEFIPSFDIANLVVELGDPDATMTALEQAVEERNALMWSRVQFPEFRRLRELPRWRALAERMRRTAEVSA